MNQQISRDRDSVGIDFEGREIPCRNGMSVAAALIDAGVTVLRKHADGDMRGLFCGMGVCQECRMTIDGQHGIRACMTPVHESLRVSRGEPRPQAKSAPTATGAAENETIRPDVLVLGGGPAGLTAAAVAAEGGAQTVLLDERSVAGGQYYKQPHSLDHVPRSLVADRQFAAGRALIERAQRSGASLLSGVEVWGVFAAGEFSVCDGNCTRIYKPKHTIVATGAYERGLPLSGWTLPGVMMTGAAQSLLRSHGVVAGKRVLIAGNGPFNLQVALEMQRAGANVVAVTELASPPGVGSIVTALRMLASAPGLTMNGVRYIAGLRRAGVPVMYRHGLVSIERHEAGLRAWTGPGRDSGIDPQSSFDVDIVCMGYGFQPRNEILRSLGCRHEFDPQRGHLVTVRNPSLETSVPHIYAIGDCCGLGGALAAMEEGVIAACATLRSLGLDPDARLSAQKKSALRELRRQRTFQRALWRLFAAPRFQAELATPDTIVCRCEGICMQELEEALAGGNAAIASVKQRTRLGMGACQGRYCAPVAAALIAQRDGRPIDEFSFFAPRSPMKPIRIADVLRTGF